MAQEEEFNILDEAVNEKSYSKANVQLSQTELNSPLGEPTFSPPPMSDDDFKQKETAEQIKAKKNPEPFNPEMKYIPKKEQTMAAEQMADMILIGYGKLHDLANKGLEVSPKKLNDMQKKGLINLNAMVQYDIGVEIPARDFFKEYNDQMKGFFKVEQEWIDDVKPVLVRVLAKKGIGMTDENYLLFRLAEDAGTKAFMFIQQKRQIGAMLKQIGESTTSEYANPAPPPPPPPPQPEQQNQEERFEPKFEGDVEIIEETNDNNPAVLPNTIVMPKRDSGNGSGKRGRKPKEQKD